MVSAAGTTPARFQGAKVVADSISVSCTVATLKTSGSSKSAASAKMSSIEVETFDSRHASSHSSSLRF